MTDWTKIATPAARSVGRSMVSALLVILIVSWAPVTTAAEDDSLRVQLQEGQSLRDLAQQHLGDPDLWAEILRMNGLTVGDVRPGIELTIPIGRIAAANRALDQALQQIQSATEQGARLFAPDQIARAISLRDAAVAQRKAGAWEAAAKLAGEASASAEEALAAALAQRDAAAEALLSDRQGWVEGQQPQDLLWSERPLNAVLIEEEKVRTLSRSTAQITFRDDSRLRLNANSQAVIQRMRVDPLSREEEAKVSLVEGDFYALLAGRSERKNFELEIPEVETEINSTNFWVRRDVSGSKFANYDERLLQVSAQGESVSLGRNEAALVRSGAPPSDKIDVLPAPALSAPGDDTVAFAADLQLSWTTVADAAGYWLEVAGDPGFERMTYSRWGLAEGSYQSTPLELGSYSGAWRRSTSSACPARAATSGAFTCAPTRRRRTCRSAPRAKAASCARARSSCAARASRRRCSSSTAARWRSTPGAASRPSTRPARASTS